MGYDPRASVAAFLESERNLGKTILDVFNQVDPFRVLIEDVEGGFLNCDEYLGYTSRCTAKLKALPSEEQRQLDKVVEAVRESFYPKQVADGWITPTNIHDIAMGIVMSLELG